MNNPKAYVKTDIVKGIATVEFFTPEKNSLPSSILKELADSITALGKSPEALVLILKSGGDRTFCAGANFQELITIDNEKEGLEFFSGFARVINAMRKCPKLIIGRVQGKAVGGGVGLAASVDYCMATQYAGIRLSELSLGIGPFTVGPAVTRKIGIAAFAEMSLQCARFYDPQWAKEKGFYAEVFDTAEEMDAAVEKLAMELATYSPEAMAEMKKLYWEGTEDWDEVLVRHAATTGRLVLSDFTKSKLAKYKK